MRPGALLLALLAVAALLLPPASAAAPKQPPKQLKYAVLLSEGPDKTAAWDSYHVTIAGALGV